MTGICHWNPLNYMEEEKFAACPIKEVIYRFLAKVFYPAAK